MGLFKIFAVALVIATILSTGYCCYCETVLNGDIAENFRNDYPFGLWVTAKKLDSAPAEYIELEGDPYIESAIATGNLTWVNQGDSPFVAKDPTGINYIQWLPDGNYYYIDGYYLDGFHDNPWKIPGPRSVSVFASLAIAWVAFIFVWRWRNTRHTTP